MKRIIFIIAAVLALAIAAVAWWYRSASQGDDAAALEARYMTAADRFITVDGARVRVREEGPRDAPVLVLLHGFTSSLESWDGWAEELADDFRIVRFDLLGHGLTGPDPRERYAPAERAAFLGALLDADELELEQVSLVGNSLGGLVAWRFAADNPGRVDRLVLIDAAAYPFNGVTEEPAPLPPAMEAFLRLAPEAGVRQGLAYAYADDMRITDERVRQVRDLMRRRGNGAAFAAHVEEFTLPDPDPDLARITAPTLILWGGQDVFVPLVHATQLEAAIPDARVIVYDDLGHTPQEEDPARTARDVRAFLTNSGAGG